MFPEIWLGSQSAYHTFLRNSFKYANEQIRYAELEAKLRDSDEDEDLSSYLASRLIDIQGSVGIISVNGSLTSEESYRDLWFGDVSYPTISTAMNMLLENQEVKSIVLALNSPGGDASGISDLGAYLKDAGKIKPVHAWTGKSALSAAYWAAASCKTVRASDLGETGSIGVIATFTSIARMLQDEGIDTHIIRSGADKALLHPAEPLSDKGKAYLEEKVQHLHTYFIENIEANRPKLKQVSRSTWAEGKSFFAKEAIEIGLVDGPVISLGELISKLNHATTSSDNRGNQMKKQILLSDAAQAQVALGVPLESVEHQEVSMPEVPEAPDAEKAPKAPEAAEKPVEAKLEAVEGDPLAVFLKDQNHALQAQLSQVNLELYQLKSQVQLLQDVEAKLQPIAIEAINRLQIGLGQTPTTLQGLPATSLAEQYAATKSEFDARFKIGRQTQQASDPAQSGRSLAELRLMASK